MKTLKTIRKIITAGIGALLIGATLGVSAFDLSDYPKPFVTDGGFDGLIVVGEKAASADVIGAIDIAASLQAEAIDVTTEPVLASISEPETSFSIGDRSDLLELNEPIGQVRETITEFDMEFLKSGKISTNKGSSDFNQYLRFENSGLKVVYGENEDDDVGEYVYVGDGELVFEYELEFEEGIESDIDNSNQLEDFEDEILNILGDSYTIVESSISGTTASMTLMRGDISDTLTEGETKTYTINEKEYEVTLSIVTDTSNPKALFTINGERTSAMEDGDTDKIGDIEIGVREVLNQEAGENTGGDLVEFYLGANKIEFTDRDYTNDGFDTSGVEINDENIEDARVMITGDESGDVFTLNSIVYRLYADSPKGDVYVSEGHGVAEELDEPEGMLNTNFNIRFAGLDEVDYTNIKFDAKGDEAYKLEFINKKNVKYNIPFVDNSNDEGLGFKFGDEEDDLHFIEPNNGGGFGNISNYDITDDDYFIVTDDNDETGVTHVLRYESIDDSEQTIDFRDADGVKTGNYNGNESVAGDATGQLVLGGKTFDFGVYKNGNDYKLAFDLDNSGNIDGGEANIVVLGGGILDLGNTETLSGDFDITLTTLASEFDEQGIGDEVVTIEIEEKTGNEIDLNVASGQTILNGTENGAAYTHTLDVVNENGNNDVKLFRTRYGIAGRVTGDTADADELVLSYPSSQVGAEVLVESVSAEIEDVVVSEIVNPIGIGLAVLDKDVKIDQDNMIVLGGPCVNTISAELMNNPALCTEGFEEGRSVIKLFDTGNNYAMMVAGATAQDTTAASYVLADFRSYTLEGTEIEVTATGLTDISIQIPEKD